MLEKFRSQILMNKKKVITIGWISLILIVLIIFASSTGTTSIHDDELTTAAEFNIGEMVFGTLIRLILVLGLIYGLFSLYKLFQKGELKAARKRLQIIETQRFSPKQVVAILRVDEQEILLGISDTQITFLKLISPPMDMEEGIRLDAQTDQKAFQDYMDDQNEH